MGDNDEGQGNPEILAGKIRAAAWWLEGRNIYFPAGIDLWLIAREVKLLEGQPAEPEKQDADIWGQR